jgi:hypothetical protein
MADKRYQPGRKNKTRPIRNKEEIQQNPDKKIDEDFKGYPHAPATDENIKPGTKEEKKTAATGVKDGEKRGKK